MIRILRTRRVASAFMAALALIAFNATAQSLDWRTFPPYVRATDIGVGPKGQVWIAGSPLMQLEAAGFNRVEGNAVRIDVGPDGPWIVDSDDRISHWNGRGWTPVAGAAKDVGIGGGLVWVIGAGAEPSGFGIYRANGSGGWTKVNGAGIRIDVDPTGKPWVINDKNEIWWYTGGHFIRVPGPAAIDVGVGSDGTVFVLGTDNSLHKRTPGGWTRMEGRFTSISVDHQGHPWGVDANSAVQVAGAAASAPAPPGPPELRLEATRQRADGTTSIDVIVKSPYEPVEVSVAYGYTRPLVSTTAVVKRGAGADRLFFDLPMAALDGGKLISKPNSTYMFEITAKNGRGTNGVYGQVRTPNGPPYIDRLSATQMRGVTAQLGAFVIPSAQVEVKFEYGTEAALAKLDGTTAGSIVRGVPGSQLAVETRASVAKLTPNTTYYYRAVGSSSLGTTRSPISSFNSGPAS